MNNTSLRSAAIAAFVSVALIGCATRAPAPALVADAQAACARLMVPIAKERIGLPNGGVAIQSAQIVAATPLSVAERAPTPAAAITPAAPEFCKVVGSIAPVDKSAPSITFQVNLPTQWNGRSLQLGGGGFNGVLINGLAHPPAMPYHLPGPLARGYATLGTDSGHQNAPGVPIQAFAANQEAFENFAHAAYKKVRDAAMDIMARYYGRAPERHYFMGSSEGGREALTMAQRYPNDFDGVFARVPVINWVALQHAYLPPNLAMMAPGAWMSPAHVQLLGDAVNRACDASDGAQDGIVSNYEACRTQFNPEALRCRVGQEPTSCLNDAQIRAVQLHHAPYRFAFPLANGVTSYPGRPVGGEATPGSGPVGGWVSWMTGQEAPAMPATPKNSIGWGFGSGTIQHFITRDAKYDLRTYDPNSFQARIQEVSALMDSTNPDLSAFQKRGGKVIVLEYMADYAQSPFAGIEYYQSVVKRMGQHEVDGFMRLYTAPGVDHVGTGAPGNVDMLDVISNWVERGRAPETLQVVEQPNVAPFTPTRARPLCQWPEWPRYKGSGERADARSFTCVQR